MADPFKYRHSQPISVSTPSLTSLIKHLESASGSNSGQHFASNAAWNLPKPKTQAEKDQEAFKEILKKQNSGHSHHSLLGSILDNLGSDVVDTIKGIPGGVVHMVEHPVATGKAIVASYKDTYGNGWGHFKDTFEAHPLGPILDALTLVTGGAGALGKSAAIIGKEGSALARLGETGKVVVRSPRAIAEKMSPEGALESGQAHAISTSANPAHRLRQNLTHRMMQSISGVTHNSLETARYAKISKARAASTKAGLQGVGKIYDTHQKIFGKLKNEHERAAANFLSKFGVHRELANPQDYADMLHGQKVLGNHVSDEMIKLMEHPATQKAVHDAVEAHFAGDESNRVLNAVKLHHQLAHLDRETINSRLPVAQQISESEAQQKAYRGLAILHGADLDENGVLQGGTHSVQDLQKVIRGQGGIEPAYVPDKMNEGRSGGRAPSGGNPGHGYHQSQMLAFKTGQLAVNQDLMGPKFLRSVSWAHAHDVHQALVHSAVKVPHSEWAEMRRRGYVAIKPTSKSPSFLTKHQSDFEKRLAAANDHEGEAQNALRALVLHEGEHTQQGGHVLMVPKRQLDIVAKEYRQSHALVRAFIHKPLNLWKKVILGWSPRFITNNVVGNAILTGLLHAGPVKAMKAVFRMVAKHSGQSGQKLADMLNLTGVHPLSDEAFNRWFAEQHHTGLATAEVPKGKGRGAGLKSGPGHAVVNADENLWRRRLVSVIARDDPAIKKELSKISTARHRKQYYVDPKKDLEVAMRRVFKDHPEVRDRIVNAVDDARGNYRDFTATEDKVRSVVPFYSWYRHIARSSTKMVLNRPGTTSIVRALGEQGSKQTDSLMGNVDEYLRAYVPFGHGSTTVDKDGNPIQHHRAFGTESLNPLNSILNVGKGVNSLVRGDAATAGRDVGEMLNPFLGAGIEQMTHQSLLNGTPLKAHHHGGLVGGIVGSVVGNLPQVKLAGDVRDTVSPKKPGIHDIFTPTGKRKKPSNPVFEKGDAHHKLTDDLLAFLGAPVKKVNITQAQAMKTKHDTANKTGFHAPAPRKKRKKKNPYFQ